MPDREVKTIRHLIYFQYAKITAKSAFGPDAKKTSYGFIKKTFRDFINDEKKWSDILREDKQLVEAEKECIYCGSKDNLSWEHIVPKSLLINEQCPDCDKIQGIHNQIRACKSCNSIKETKGLYRFYKELYPEVKNLSDQLPPLLEKKYLKTIYYCHICKGTLDSEPVGISVMDLDLWDFKKIYTSQIPIIEIDTDEQKPFVDLVDQMLETQKKFHVAKNDNDKKMFKQKIDIIDRQIDELVYKLYGLTEEEIKIVEGQG